MSSAPPAPAKSSPRRAAIASLVGTTLEWYDFTLFTRNSGAPSRAGRWPRDVAG